MEVTYLFVPYQVFQQTDRPNNRGQHDDKFFWPNDSCAQRNIGNEENLGSGVNLEHAVDKLSHGSGQIVSWFGKLSKKVFLHPYIA